MQNQFIQGFTSWQGGWLSLPRPPQYPNVALEQKTTDCFRKVDKSTKGLNKKHKDKKRKIALEKRLSETNALVKKHKDYQKEFQNNSLKFYFKL